MGDVLIVFLTVGLVLGAMFVAQWAEPDAEIPVNVSLFTVIASGAIGVFGLGFRMWTWCSDRREELETNVA